MWCRLILFKNVLHHHELHITLSLSGYHPVRSHPVLGGSTEVQNVDDGIMSISHSFPNREFSLNVFPLNGIIVHIFNHCWYNIWNSIKNIKSYWTEFNKCVMYLPIDLNVFQTTFNGNWTKMFAIINFKLKFYHRRPVTKFNLNILCNHCS